MTDHHLGIIATPGAPTMIIGTDTGSVILDPTHITLDTGVTAAMTPTGVTPDQFIDPHIIALSCHRSSSSYCYCCNTPHCRSSSHRNFSQDDSRPRTHKSCKQHYKPELRSSSSLPNNALEKQGQKALTGHN